jgi:hypothetical protein
MHLGIVEKRLLSIQESPCLVTYQKGTSPPSFYNKLESAKQEGDRDKMILESKTYLETPAAKALRSGSKHRPEDSARVMTLATTGKRIKTGTFDSPEEAIQLIEETFGALDSGDVDAPSDVFIERIWMTTFALACRPHEAPEYQTLLIQALVMVHMLEVLLEHIANDEEVTAELLDTLANATVILPAALFPMPLPTPAQTTSEVRSANNDPPPTPPLTLSGDIIGDEALGGWIAPSAIGTLRLVRKSPRGYRPGEIALIDNLAPGERRELRRTTRETTEQTTTTREEQRDAEDRLTTSTQEALSRAIVSALDQVTYDYGNGSQFQVQYGQLPTNVTLTGSWTKTLAPDSGKTTQEMARTVTGLASKSLSHQVQTDKRLRLILEQEQERSSVIENASQDACRHTVHRWLDRIYYAYLVRVGNRLVLQFLLLHPAREFIARTLSRAGVDMKSPPKPRHVLGALVGKPPEQVGASDLDESNYRQLGEVYHLYDLDAPPAATLQRAVLLTTGELQQIPVEPGYEAQSAIVQIALDAGIASITLLIGDKSTGAISTAPTTAIELAPLIDQVPVAFRVTLDASDQTQAPQGLDPTPPGASVSITLTTQRTAAIEKQWQDRTWALIQEAYHSEHEAFFSRAGAGPASNPWMRSSGARVTIEREAIERGCLTLLAGLSASRDETIKSTQSSGGEFSAFAFEEPELIFRLRALLRFDEMAYGFMNAGSDAIQGQGDESWRALLGSFDEDPRFTDFLLAKSARVLLPVDLEDALATLFYLAQRDLWYGDDAWAPAFEQDVDVALALHALRHEPRRHQLENCWEIRIPTHHTIVSAHETMASIDLATTLGDQEA